MAVPFGSFAQVIAYRETLAALDKAGGIWIWSPIYQVWQRLPDVPEGR